MFGFRFSDSDYITIRCEVGIFPSNTDKVNCPLTVFFTFDDRKDDILELTSYSYVIIRNSFFWQKLCNGSGRKRRGIENVEVKTKFAASKIRVYDNKDMYQMENKSPQKSCKLSILYFHYITFCTIDLYCN